MSMLRTSTRRRAAQARALLTLEHLIIATSARLADLRWTVEPNGDLSGAVPPLASEEEIREVFDGWAALLGAQRRDEVSAEDTVLLSAVKNAYGDELVYVSLRATIPRQREAVSA